MKKIILSFLLFNAINGFAQIPTLGLINRWNFNGNLNNEIATGINLDSNEYVRFGRDRFGNQNSALFSTYGNGPSVGGTGNSLNIPQGLSNFTISFWMYCRPNDNATWFSFGSDSTNKEFVVLTRKNWIEVGFKGSFVNAYTTTENGKWRNIILSYNGDELQIYEGNTMLNAFKLNLGTSGFNLKMFSGINGAFNSDSERLIDDLYFYNRILTGVEKTQLAAEGNNCNNYYNFFRYVNNTSAVGINDGKAAFSISGPAYPIIVNLESSNWQNPKQFTFNNADHFEFDSLPIGNFALVSTGSCPVQIKQFSILPSPPPPCDVDLSTTNETIDATGLSKCDGNVKLFVNVSIEGQPIDFTGRLEVKYLNGPTNFGTFNILPDSISSLCVGSYKALITPIGKAKGDGEKILTCADTVEFTINAKTTSVKEITLGKVSIYPNPAQKILYVNSTVEIKSAILINNVGQTTEVNLVNNTIEIGNLLSGVYIIQVKDFQGNLYTNKFIKE